MDVLYLPDCYTKEFEATVTHVTDDRFVTLDKTAFYPDSGGQPHDTGVLTREKDGREFPVTYTRKMDDLISHEVTITDSGSGSGLAAGDRVTGKIDWERRYHFMRSHTACHVLSAVIHKETDALITG
ncbi:MAG: alanyl-tRNA editing protein, partial [Euryarchaeota archaeon]|nr:alanyl-tRNA editing protein [Euryarchaeota archaeon]